MAAYAGNQAEAIETGLDANPISEAIRALMEKTPEWTGTASALLQKLVNLAGDGSIGSRAWPRTSQELGKQLNRLAPALRAVGVEVDHTRTGRGRQRIIVLRTIGKTPVRAVRSASEPTAVIGISSVRTTSSTADEVSGVPGPACQPETSAPPVQADNADNKIADIPGPLPGPSEKLQGQRLKQV